MHPCRENMGIGTPLDTPRALVAMKCILVSMLAVALGALPPWVAPAGDYRGRTQNRPPPRIIHIIKVYHDIYIHIYIYIFVFYFIYIYIYIQKHAQWKRSFTCADKTKKDNPIYWTILFSAKVNIKRCVYLLAVGLIKLLNKWFIQPNRTSIQNSSWIEAYFPYGAKQIPKVQTNNLFYEQIT